MIGCLENHCQSCGNFSFFFQISYSSEFRAVCWSSSNRHSKNKQDLLSKQTHNATKSTRHPSEVIIALQRNVALLGFRGHGRKGRPDTHYSQGNRFPAELLQLIMNNFLIVCVTFEQFWWHPAARNRLFAQRQNVNDWQFKEKENTPCSQRCWLSKASKRQLFWKQVGSAKGILFSNSFFLQLCQTVSLHGESIWHRSKQPHITEPDVCVVDLLFKLYGSLTNIFLTFLHPKQLKTDSKC